MTLPKVGDPTLLSVRPWGSLAALCLLAFMAVACGGKASDALPQDEPVTHDPVIPSGECDDPGSMAPADDGCSMCTCTDLGWACDDAACPGVECVEGDQKPADDACNTCSCQDGTWLCTKAPCVQPSCEEGATTNDGCNSCICQQGAWSCTDVYCPPPCEDGTVKAAGDGCNTCECMVGEWSCTELACAEPSCKVPDELPDQNCQGNELFARAAGTDACCALCYSLPDYRYYDSMEACEASKVCTPGAVKYADDECNTCECAWDGTWVCTAADCQPTYCGGFSGSCAEDEFCAYEANMGGCGISDANAICRPRPTSCDGDYAPVCGCDAKTYSNACEANAAGTGLLTDAACDSAE